MMTHFVMVLAAVLLLLAGPVLAGGPPTAEEAARQARVMGELNKALASAADNDARFTALGKALQDEPNPDCRRQLLELADRYPGPEQEALLTRVLKEDPDAGLRSRAATTLGRHGSAAALGAVAKAAATDPTTDMQTGCIRGRSSARRSATFALAELAARHPGVAREAVARLRALPGDLPAGAARDPEDLADARRQALYQVTRDEEWVKPFCARLASADPRERERGVIAFRFLGLKKVPGAVAVALKDPDAGVRSWAELVVREIGSPAP